MFTLRFLRKKITDNNLVLTQAYKGKMTVILHHKDYNGKMTKFMESNHIYETPEDPA
jgi:hypothetical protein